MNEALALNAINIVLSLFANGGAVSALIDKARAENRTITPQEWDEVLKADDSARSDLDLAIAKAKAEGR